MQPVYTDSHVMLLLVLVTITFYEEGLLVIDVHQTVGTGVTVTSKRVSDQLLPGRLGDRDVIVLHPAALIRVIDVGPVVACVGLALVDQDCMEPVRHLNNTHEISNAE